MLIKQHDQRLPTENNRNPPELTNNSTTWVTIVTHRVQTSTEDRTRGDPAKIIQDLQSLVMTNVYLLLQAQSMGPSLLLRPRLLRH